MKNNIIFKYADPWLLLAIIYASEKGSAYLSDIIAQGDFINHAIFTAEELEGGLFRLIMAGYIIEDKNGYKATDEIINLHKKYSTAHTSVYQQLAFIRQEIDAPEWFDGYNPQEANQGIVYKKINKEVVENAIREYNKKSKNLGR